MKPATSSFANSFLMASLLSGVKHHSCCFYGAALWSTFKQWSIKSLGTPGISAGFHANISRLAPKEADEHVFLIVVQAASNQSSLGRVAFVQLDGFDADVTGVGFYPRLARPLIGDLHLCVDELDFCGRFWHA
jgi:hypothetical protein